MSASFPAHAARVLPLALAALPFTAGSAHAQTPNPALTPQLPTVIVSAQRIEQPLSDVLADVSFIDRQQIERSGAVTVATLLQRQPGLEITQNGGPGTATAVFTRGANNEFTAVYIDGVRVDNQSGMGGASWQALALDQIDHIEIVRGPAAAVYGSDAVAGVVQIFTRKGAGPFTPYVEAGLGSHRTRQVKAGFSGSHGAVDYSLGAERDLSRGFDATTPANFGHNPDRDGYRQSAASGRLGAQFSPRQRLDLTGTYSKMDAQFDDGFPHSALASNRQKTLGANWKADWTRDYSTQLMVSQSQFRYDDNTPPTPGFAGSMNKTRLRNYTLLNEYRRGNNRFTGTLERREDHLTNTTIGRGRHQNAVALGYGYAGGRHTLQLNARYDKDSEFGGRTTGGVAYGYEFVPHWRVTAGAATAFRVPTLYQRFSQFGDAALKPQKSRNIELGLRWANQGRHASATLYRNTIRDLVDFGAGGSCGQLFGCYISTGKARLQGLTLEGGTRVGQVNLGGSLDWMKPTDRATGKLLARRARRMLKLHADTRVAGWTLGGEADFFSHRWDDPANTVRLKSYEVFNFYATTTIARDWDVVLRVDNLFDKNYELASTYNTPGRVVFASLRWTWR